MKTNPRTITLPAVFKAAYITSLSTEDSIGAGRSKALHTLSSAQQHNIMTMKTSVPFTSHELIPGVTL